MKHCDVKATRGFPYLLFGSLEVPVNVDSNFNISTVVPGLCVENWCKRTQILEKPTTANSGKKEKEMFLE